MRLKIIKLEDFLSKRVANIGSRLTDDFIYDGKQAWFHEHDASDMHIVSRGGFDLYYRGNCDSPPLLDRELPHKPSGPLLTSHLQKAIRSGHATAALQTTATLLYGDRLKLLRRLPIIMVEDANVVWGTPIVTWLMMAHGCWEFTEKDASNILCHVELMTRAKTCLDVRGIGRHPVLSHKQVSVLGAPNIVDLRCLLIRKAYGGMKGDMWRLTNAVHSQCLSPHPCFRRDIESISVDDYGFLNLIGDSFLVAGIDYHPFPWILNRIASSSSSLRSSRVKQLIWIIESAPNFRKPNTLSRAAQARSTSDWPLIEDALHKVRLHIIDQERKRKHFPTPRGKKQ